MGVKRDSGDLRDNQEQSGDVPRVLCFLIGTGKSGGRWVFQECILGGVLGGRLGGVVFYTVVYELVHALRRNESGK